MPSPSPFQTTSGEGVEPVYEAGSHIPSSWGTAWGKSWSTAWGWHNRLIPYLLTSKPRTSNG